VVRRVPLQQGQFRPSTIFVPAGGGASDNTSGIIGGGNRYNANSGRQGRVEELPPPHYRCHRCGEGGHFIQFCPTNSDPQYDRMKKSTGIPKVFLQALPDSMDSGVSGALLMPGGGRAIVKPNSAEFDRMAQAEKQKTKQNLVTPDLQCPLCKDLMKKAVQSSCCKKNFCDGCIRRALFEDPNSACPLCKKVSPPEMLTPNMKTRSDVVKLEEQRKNASHTSTADEPPPLEPSEKADGESRDERPSGSSRGAGSDRSRRSPPR
jgi:E3 ubiquitin-protein ligase RBBP6